MAQTTHLFCPLGEELYPAWVKLSLLEKYKVYCDKGKG